MSPISVLWIASAVLATILLSKLVYAKQNRLTTLLRDYVQTELEWAEKRAAAARVARKAAAKKVREAKIAPESVASSIADSVGQDAGTNNETTVPNPASIQPTNSSGTQRATVSN